MAKNYAIATFRDAGPIKSWGALRAAQVHNSREKPIPHAEEDVPPVHMIGSGNLVADTMTTLRTHGIDPKTLRKNGVIAYELVVTASHDFFYPEGGDETEDQERFLSWAHAQHDFVTKKYGVNRVVSLVAHLDERTPHIHAVILPLEQKVDGRRSDSAARWSLVGRTISGPGEYQRLQDEYADAMSGFGLCRGEPQSNRKHKPVSKYLEELRAREEEAEAAKRLAELRLNAAEIAITQTEREAAELTRLLKDFGRGIEVVGHFLKKVRALPPYALSPQLIEMRGNAETMVARAQQKEFSIAAPVAVRQQWREIQQEL